MKKKEHDKVMNLQVKVIMDFLVFNSSVQDFFFVKGVFDN